MGREAMGRNQTTQKRHIMNTWKTVVLEHKVKVAQQLAR